MFVKICGITRAEDAAVAVDAGARAIGFVFWPKSPRFIDPYRARAIAAVLPPFVTPVGGHGSHLLGHCPDDVVKAADELCRRAGELELGEGVACGVASTEDPIGPVRSARRLFRLADAAQYRAKAERADRPVVAGREGPDDPVVRLADTEPSEEGTAIVERRRFRGRLP